MTRIDAHHHLWRVRPGTPGSPVARNHDWLDTLATHSLQRDFTLDDLLPHLKEAGIDRTILVQVLPDPDETLDFLDLAADSATVAGVVGWADLVSPGLPDTLAAMRSRPGGPRLVSLRHLVQSEPDPNWLCRREVRRGLRTIADAGLAYDLLTLPHQLPAAIDTVRALPDLTFVLDHLSKPPIASGHTEPWSVHLRELAAEPNVHCKLSGMVSEADADTWTVEGLRPYAEAVLDAFGPTRLMFGSDWPVCLTHATYEQVVSAADELTASLTAAERTDVFGGTAVRAYKLEAHHMNEEQA
ncbi:amidohydrolase family protein [Streptomyces sp. NPDC048430]|uniref:amidohydrolase family protein n=1 Tax=unclassified Streptomyces TaxID=2593676 RepID=UPI00342BAFED